jgi:hypothetical protein
MLQPELAAFPDVGLNTPDVVPLCHTQRGDTLVMPAGIRSQGTSQGQQAVHLWDELARDLWLSAKLGDGEARAYRLTLLVLASTGATLLVVFVPTAMGGLERDAFGASQAGPTGETHGRTSGTLGHASFVRGHCRLGRHGDSEQAATGTEDELEVRQKKAEQRARAQTSRCCKCEQNQVVRRQKTSFIA